MNFQLGKLSQELEGHGLKQDDYRRVAKYCTVRLSAMRHQHGLLYRKKGKPFSYKPLTPALLAESSGLSALPTYRIVRLWAQTQILMTESRTLPRKKHHIRKLARKIIKTISLLPKSSEGFIFGLWSHGVAHFAMNAFGEAKRYLDSFLEQLKSREEADMAPWRSAATLSRFCEYQMKKSGSNTSAELIANPFTQLETNNAGLEECDSVVVINGISFELSSEDVMALKSKRYSKIQDGELSLLIGNLKDVSASAIEALSQCAKLAPVVKYYKAMFASGLEGGEKIARELYEQSAPTLKKGVQLVCIKPLPSKKLELAKPDILKLPIPAKPIVYDVAYDMLQTPQLSGGKKSLLGGWF